MATQTKRLALRKKAAATRDKPKARGPSQYVTDIKKPGKTKAKAATKARAKPKSNGLSTLTAKQRAAAAKLAPGKVGKTTATFTAKEMAAIRRLLK